MARPGCRGGRGEDWMPAGAGMTKGASFSRKRESSAPFWSANLLSESLIGARLRDSESKFALQNGALDSRFRENDAPLVMPAPAGIQSSPLPPRQPGRAIAGRSTGAQH